MQSNVPDSMLVHILAIIRGIASQEQVKGTYWYIVHARLSAEDATAGMILGYGNHCKYVVQESMFTLIKELLKKQ